MARLFRSAGCSDQEITLVCNGGGSAEGWSGGGSKGGSDETIIIENASFYALPAAALNCSGGPMGEIVQ